MTAPLLDTHAWIWWIGADPRLRRSEAGWLDALPPGERPYLSDISLWEATMLAAERRLTLSPSVAEWLEAAAHPRTVQILRITPAIAAETAALPASFGKDPADRIIVATSRVLNVPLLTHDRAILRSKLVKHWTPPA